MSIANWDLQDVVLSGVYPTQFLPCKKPSDRDKHKHNLSNNVDIE